MPFALFRWRRAAAQAGRAGQGLKPPQSRATPRSCSHLNSGTLVFTLASSQGIIARFPRRSRSSLRSGAKKPVREGTHFYRAALWPSLCSEGGNPAGSLLSTPSPAARGCTGLPPWLRGTSLGFYTALLRSVLQQPEPRELRDAAVTGKDLVSGREPSLSVRSVSL